MGHNGPVRGRGRGWLILLCVTLCCALLLDPIMTTAANRRTTPQPAQTSWKLAFQDDFDGSSLNERIWETQYPWGRDRRAVGELQWYASNESNPSNPFKVANSKLQISAKPIQPGQTQQPGENHSYSSGLISTHKSFATEYGRFEIRCKLPRGKGLWPAFWLLPTDTSWPPEIDVFENIGTEPNTVHMTTHWLENGNHRQSGKEFVGPDFSKDFHTFAVEWTATTMIWYVDGVERHRVENGSPRGQMYLLANMAVGGSWPGAPDADNRAFPATFDIDYIRAYTAEAAPSAKPLDDNGKGKKDKGKNTDGKRKKKKRKGRIARANAANS